MAREGRVNCALRDVRDITVQVVDVNDLPLFATRW